MAYQLISAPSNAEAVMTAIRDFAVANGYTNEGFTASNPGTSRGSLTLSRDDLYVSFRWEGTETTKSIAMYQSLGYTPGEQETPWNHPDDSGNGTTSATSLSSQRRVEEIGSGPFISLELFYSNTDVTSGNTCPHIYCVLQYATGKYRHFGFGLIDKYGDWTGGEWVGGHVWSNFQSNESSPTSGEHSVLLDGLATNGSETATMHAEGLPGQDGSSKWANVWDSTSMAETDRAGNPRANFAGCVRSNLYTYIFGRYIPSNLNGFVPFMPMPIFYRRDTSGDNQRKYLLGHMANARMIQMRNYNPGDEINVGGQLWRIYPMTSKANAGGGNEESKNMGIAYARTA